MSYRWNGLKIYGKFMKCNEIPSHCKVAAWRGTIRLGINIEIKFELNR